MDPIRHDLAVSSRIDEIIETLRHGDFVGREQARDELATAGRIAVPALVAMLHDPHATQRWEAAKTLGEIHDATAADALVAALEDRDFDVRWVAAEGLIRLGRIGLIPLMRALAARGTSSIWLREGAHHVLWRIPRRRLPPEAVEVRNALDKLWTSIEVPRAARAALAALREAEEKAGLRGR